MGLGNDKLDQIKKILEDAPDIFLPFFEVEKEITAEGLFYLKMKTNDKKSPNILQVSVNDNLDIVNIVPYYLLKERPEAQITSYVLGKGLCNLAEVRELSGSLYSRHCGSYELRDLTHQDAIQSRIALWVHDCLTQDLDHHHALNRYAVMEGPVMSYDYGMSFLRNYFPPFYTFDLGITDDDITSNKRFLLNLISQYARRTKLKEDTFVNDLIHSYPKTINKDACRYYFRNFKSYFAKRIYSGRFIEKLKSTPFITDGALEFGDAMGFNIKNIHSWKELILKLSETRFQHMDLQGLDLSGADLRKADLKKANLRLTNLKNANLEKADLRGADLAGANMEYANIKGALTG